MSQCYCPEPIVEEYPDDDGTPFRVCAKCNGDNPKIVEKKRRRKCSENLI